MAKKPKEPKPAEPGIPAAPRGLAPQADDVQAQELLKPKLALFLELRADKDDLKRQATENQEELDLLNGELVELFNKLGITSMKLAGMGNFYTMAQALPKVVDEDALFADLKKRKMGSVIKETVHYQTLRATINEMRQMGKPDLKGVDIFEKEILAFRSESTKKEK